MIAMIFEYWFRPDDDVAYQAYLEESARLRELLPEAPGFLGVQRFASETDPRHFLAVGYFEDEAAVAAWRGHEAHRHAQVRAGPVSLPDTGSGWPRFFETTRPLTGTRPRPIAAPCTAELRGSDRV